MKIGLLNCNEICYNSLNFFLDSIERALIDKGIQTYHITTIDNEVLMQEWDAIIGINNEIASMKLNDGTYLMDFFECPMFMILVDPPYYHHSILESHSENVHVIVLDRGHVEYCKRYYAGFKSVEMAYLLGPVGECKAYEEKKIDILFAGSVADLSEMKQRASGIYKEEWADVIFDLAIYMGTHYPHYTMLQTMEAILKKSSLSYTDGELKALMYNLGAYAEMYLRGFYRKKIVSALVDAGLRVHVAGKGWEQLYSQRPDNLIWEGCVDFGQMADLITDSKLVLNVMPWFKDGIHDRILTTMLNGSICVTDTSSYIESHFEDGEELIVYKLEDVESLPHRINEILKDEMRAKTIAEKGRQKATENYSWDMFVDKYILRHINC